MNKNIAAGIFCAIFLLLNMSQLAAQKNQITPQINVPKPLQVKPNNLKRLPVGPESRMKEKEEQPSEATDSEPPPTKLGTTKVTPAEKVTPAAVPLPHTRPLTSAARINREDLRKLKELEDSTNGLDNAAPDVFGPREDGRPDSDIGRGPIDPLDHQQSRSDFEGSESPFGYDPANPGGGDARRSSGFHTPAKNPGAAGGVINDPRGMASDGTMTQYPDGSHAWSETTKEANGGRTNRETWWSLDGSRDSYITRENGDGSGSRLGGHWDPDGNLTDITRQTWGTDKNGEQLRINEEGTTISDYTEPDSQPGAEGRGPGGNDNCGWNPISGCTKRAVKIWDAMGQPGSHQDTDGSAAGPSLGQEAVTNTGDSTFDSGVSGGGGGGQPDPCVTAGGCGPIRDAGGGPGPAN